MKRKMKIITLAISKRTISKCKPILKETCSRSKKKRKAKAMKMDNKKKRTKKWVMSTIKKENRT